MAELTVYPDAGSGSTTVDGTVERGTDGTWSEVRDGAGTAVTTTNSFYGTWLGCKGTTNVWDGIRRCIFTFDTSGLGAGASISAAILSLYGFNKDDNWGNQSARLTASTPAADNNLANDDYGQVGATAMASDIAISAWSTSGYNDFTLNASGISNISKTGISKFGLRLASDADNSAPTWSSYNAAQAYHYFADYTGTTRDPKLVITYTTGGTNFERTVSFALLLDASVSRQAGYGRAFTAALALDAAFSRLVGYARDFTTAISLSPSFSRVQGFVRSFTAALVLSPSFSRAAAYTRNFTAAIAATATFTRQVAYKRTVAFGLKLTSSISALISSIIYFHQDREVAITFPANAASITFPVNEAAITFPANDVTIQEL